jgi:Concanavalin A-like lectin/glucanases superfamily
MLPIFNLSPIARRFVFLTLLSFGITALVFAAEFSNLSANAVGLCASQPRGLVAWYKGEGNVFDSTNNSQGFFNGTYAPGKVGQAFNFDGVSNYAALTTGDIFEDRITLAAWIKPTSTNGSQTIVSRNNAGIANLSSFQFSIIDRRLYFQVNQNDSTSRSYITSSPVISVGVFQHVAASFDSETQMMEIYVNGISFPLTLVNSDTVTSFPHLTGENFTPITLGAFTGEGTPNNRYFSGQIDEVLIFRQVLSAAEVQSIYNAGSAGVCNNFEVSGKISTANGRLLDNVLISTEDSSKQTYSAIQGYNIRLDEDHNHTLTPIFSTHSFSPVSYSFNSLTANQSAKDFIATLINDNFTNAVQLSGEFGDIDGNNQDATRESGEPLHAGVVGGTSVWYRWRAPRTGQFTFTTEGSKFDTLLAVYQGTSVTNLLQVAANDNTATATSSRVTFTAQANTDYYIAVDGRAGAVGSGYFKMIYYPADVIPGFTVSGSVTANGRSITVVKAEDLNGDVVAFAIVNNQGKYTIVLPRRVNSFKLGVSNSPEFDSETFSNITQDITHNFLIRSGSVDNGGGVIIFGSLSLLGLNSTSDLTVTISGSNINGEFQCGLSAAAGSITFTCPGLLPFGTYTITPSHPVHTFSPSSRTITLGNSNVVAATFITNDAAGFTISGKVMQGSIPLNGVSISAGFASVETDVNGNYSIGPLPAGKDYNISASLPGFNFQPSQTIFQNLQSNQTLNFSAVSNCSYTLSSLQQTVSASGGFASFDIMTNTGCPWEAKTNSNGFTVSSPLSYGNGTISYFVEPNTGAARVGTITVAGQIVTINQSAASAKSRKRIRIF